MLTLSACALLRAAPSQANVQITFTNINLLDPTVSGTNCCARAHFQSGSPLTQVRLYVGGTLVHTKAWPLFQGPQQAQLTVAWDSTHFPDGAQVGYSADAWNSMGNYTIAHLPTPRRVYNKALLLGNRTCAHAQDTVNHVDGLCQGINHTTIASTSADVGTIRGWLPTSTVFFMTGHGNVGKFSDCLWEDGMNLESHSVYAWMVQYAVTAKPAPPYHFAFLNTCWGAFQGSNTLAWVFRDPPPDDQTVNYAWLGFARQYWISPANAQWTRDVWAALTTGFTVSDATAYANWRKQAPPDGDGPNGSAEPTIYYDRQTKIHCVYGGRPGEWFRPLD